MSQASPDRTITLTAGEDLAAFRFVKLSSGVAVYADANEDAIGITQEAIADTKQGAVMPIGSGGLTSKLEVNGNSVNIAAGDRLVAANDGIGVKAVATTAEQLIRARALEDSTADGDIIEVIPMTDMLADTGW
jgi:hypothetical protein